jgi:hypothetical protein
MYADMRNSLLLRKPNCLLKKMKTKALEALKTKFEGVSDAILSRVADKIAKTATNEEEVTTAVEGVTFQQLLESYGDSRATEATQSAVTNYEKKHGLKEGKKVEKQAEKKSEEKKTDDDTPEWVKQLMESNKALTDRIAKLEGDKTATTRKSALAKVLEKAPEKIRTRYEKDFARMNFADDDDFNAWVEEITPDVEGIANDFASKGGVVGRPKGGGSATVSGKDNPALQARIAEQQAATEAPAIIGLP